MSPDVLVFAIGNRARGDDALGPLLGERLAQARLPGVVVEEVMQLQVEHALLLSAPRRVVFVDAALGLSTPFTTTTPRPADVPATFSHALSPGALLAVHRRLDEAPVRSARVLALNGARFGLGEPPSEAGRAALEAAWPALCALVSAAGDATAAAPGRARA